MVEIEAAQAILTRLSEWGKLLGLLVYVPLIIFAFVLGLLGIKSHNDFTALVATSKKDVEDKTNEARTQAAVLQQQSQTVSENAKRLASEIDARRRQLAELGRIDEKLRAQRTELDKVKAFVSSSRGTRATRIMERIGKLPDDKAIVLVKNIPVQDNETAVLLQKADPRGVRTANATNARRILLMLVPYAKESDGDLDAWEAALTVAEKQ